MPTPTSPSAPQAVSALDRARKKAFWRLVPLCFICYVIAYIDRVNVSFVKLKMVNDLAGFTEDVFGTGAGIFFIGYFLLEVPGSLLVERWSARKWISRIMISWGVIAACTAMVKTPGQFYVVRFVLGLAEAGFYPGVIVYLTHWFPTRDRGRALAFFFIGGPIAQLIYPVISTPILRIGTSELIDNVMVHFPMVGGMHGWQWVYIFWGIPAVILGVVVFLMLTDRPGQARWLSADERVALQAELDREHAELAGRTKHMGILAALGHPKVLLLALAYFFAVTANYGIEFFLPTILEKWHHLSLGQVRWYVMVPNIGLLIGQLVLGYTSDRTGERWKHASWPIYFAAVGLTLAINSQASLALTLLFFALTMAGIRGYLPAFWAVPNLFLTGAGAAGSIGFINSVGNLGGFVGSKTMGKLATLSGSYQNGLYVMVGCMVLAASILVGLAAWHKRELRRAQPALAPQ
jgi:ACS family tartrate transporter-like MFS transporter